ncbi:MAG TPA: NnrU family protein [Rhizomicrobium sp.]|nr:NnrU family protein [Rhizomicrobium sp.]
MTMLIAAAAVFLGIHLLIAGTRVRDAITNTIGENAYLVLFSLASIAVIAWLVMAFNAASASPENQVLYTPWIGIRHLAIPVVALAFLLAVPGLLMPNPTSLKQEGAASKEVKGILRITRHPFLWGVAIWSAFHVAANGDEAAVIFFGTFFLLGIFGTFSIDAKRRRKMGAAWDAFAAKTSNMPFGRGGVRFGELLDWRLAVAVVAFLGVLFSHAHLFGVSPFPSGWVPY